MEGGREGGREEEKKEEKKEEHGMHSKRVPTLRRVVGTTETSATPVEGVAISNVFLWTSPHSMSDDHGVEVLSTPTKSAEAMNTRCSFAISGLKP